MRTSVLKQRKFECDDDDSRLQLGSNNSKNVLARAEKDDVLPFRSCIFPLSFILVDHASLENADDSSIRRNDYCSAQVSVVW
jgi:hypothetical protein